MSNKSKFVTRIFFPDEDSRYRFKAACMMNLTTMTDVSLKLCMWFVEYWEKTGKPPLVELQRLLEEIEQDSDRKDSE
ncbi:plasmid partition protein ParG [Roseofilum casamattae]|uniref:Plasmid partition protein ParG n=1 Tax=Roseofilum casamattae BLCC-M143 TaxID=3022442 RepID=A0ABT7C1F1_9CYAN|nr:plasmid partition protein ParG [Roseofilum casamattae]MDJ1185266.1 plasmid partition protein ParG [Roseofilum casamattae BLCC-M143]